MKKGILILMLFTISVYASDKKQSAYLISSFQNKDVVESKLKSVGLEVLGSTFALHGCC